MAVEREPAGGERMLVQIRLPRGLVKRIDHMSVDWDLYRAQMMERILQAGIDQLEQQGPRLIAT